MADEQHELDEGYAQWLDHVHKEHNDCCYTPATMLAADYRSLRQRYEELEKAARYYEKHSISMGDRGIDARRALRTILESTQASSVAGGEEG